MKIASGKQQNLNLFAMCEPAKILDDLMSMDIIKKHAKMSVYRLIDSLAKRYCMHAWALQQGTKCGDGVVKCSLVCYMRSMVFIHPVLMDFSTHYPGRCCTCTKYNHLYSPGTFFSASFCL